MSQRQSYTTSIINLHRTINCQSRQQISWSLAWKTFIFSLALIDVMKFCDKVIENGLEGIDKTKWK